METIYMLAQTREQKGCCLRICLFQPFVFRHCGLRPAIYCDRFATRCIRCLAVWIAGQELPRNESRESLLSIPEVAEEREQRKTCFLCRAEAT